MSKQNDSTKRPYERPSVTSIGSVADLTRNGFSQGNDVGQGKSGGKDAPLPSF